MEPMYLSIQQKETGKQIKKLLMENGYTVKDVQNAMGFENPQAIYKWISGRSLPSLDNFVILSRLLHTSIEDILVVDGDVVRLWGIIHDYRKSDCGFSMVLNRWYNDKALSCSKLISEQKTKEKGGRKEMQTMTSAYANKMLKSLEEDKAFWVNKEATSSTYVAAINEEPVVPEYDYTEVAATITSLDEKIAIIKHALNVTNSNEKVQVGDAEMSIDTILIKMAQLNKRKSVLDQMRKQLPKAREEQRSYMSRNTVPEYRYINYDLELIKKEYEAVSKTIMEMQMALDKYNQTVQFEVDI